MRYNQGQLEKIATLGKVFEDQNDLRMYITGMVMVVLKLYAHGVKSTDSMKVILYPEKQSLSVFCIFPEIFHKHTKIMYISGSQMEAILPPTGTYIQVRKRNLNNPLHK